MSKLVKFLVPYIIALGALLMIDVLFFAPILSGKVISQNDDISFRAMGREAKTFYETNKTPTYWTNSIFGGMPVYTIYDAGIKSSLIDHLIGLFSLRRGDGFGFFLFLSLGAFIAFCILGVGPYLSVLGAIAIGFATNHIGLLDAGHMSKIGTLGFVPLIIVGSFLMFKQKWVLGFISFTFGLLASIKLNHVQMTYLAGMVLFIYFALEAIKWIREKNMAALIKASVLHGAGIVIAILANIGMLAGLKDYSNDTMRGGSILSVKSAQASDIGTASSETGLGWDYAMQWSNGFSDLLSLFAPGAVGGSSGEKWPSTSDLGRLYRNGGGKYTNAPLYWGALPFTSSPDYLGIIIIGLFFMGLVVVKGPVKWFALISTLILIFLSMGKNFPLINRLFFDYLPYYNKFRTPNSILNVLSITVPFFSIYSLYTFLKINWSTQELKKMIMRTLIPLAGFLLLMAIIGPSLFDMHSASGDRGFESNAQAYKILLDTRASFMRSDFFRSLIFLLLGIVLIYYYGLRKIKANYFLIGLIGLTLFDLWSVAKRYIDEGKFQVKKVNDRAFTPRAVDNEILKDKDPYYRVFDISVNAFNDGIYAYFHKLVGGYHPAKLRRYQDMIDYYISKGNINVLSMLNTKYIIGQNGELQSNANALGNAWFVSSVRAVNSPDEEIASVGNMDLANEAAVLTKEFSNYLSTNSFSKNGTIQLTSYAPNKLIYNTQTTADQFAVFSDIWYGPNKGWQAYIDGKPVDHIRTNYILRGLKIPNGNHTIEFKFDLPRTISFMRNLSWIIGMILGIIMISYLILRIRKWLLSDEIITHEIIPQAPVLTKSKEIKGNVSTITKNKK